MSSAKSDGIRLFQTHTGHREPAPWESDDEDDFKAIKTPVKLASLKGRLADVKVSVRKLDNNLLDHKAGK